MLTLTDVLLIMLWTALLLHIIKCEVNYVVRKWQTNIMIIYYYVSNYLSAGLSFSHMFIEIHLWKPCIHGCLVNIGDKIDFQVKMGSLYKWSICLNLLSRRLTLLPVKPYWFYRCHDKDGRWGPARLIRLLHLRLADGLYFWRVILP
jgi:hypothetical protein